jgi:hypothetical protein
MMLWQEIAENFYPERADFTINRSLGTDFGAGMMTSYPFICRRDLGDQVGQMLRSERLVLHGPDGCLGAKTPTAKAWLQWAAGFSAGRCTTGSRSSRARRSSPTTTSRPSGSA